MKLSITLLETCHEDKVFVLYLLWIWAGSKCLRTLSIIWRGDYSPAILGIEVFNVFYVGFCRRCLEVGIPGRNWEFEWSTRQIQQVYP